MATNDFVDTKTAALELKISQAGYQILLWAFVFWVSQLAALFAFLKYFI